MPDYPDDDVLVTRSKTMVMLSCGRDLAKLEGEHKLSRIKLTNTQKGRV